MKDGFLKIQVNGWVEYLNIEQDEYSERIPRLIGCDDVYALEFSFCGIRDFCILYAKKGARKKRPSDVNPLASLLIYNVPDRIFGDVILCKRVPSHSCGLPDEIEVTPIDSNSLIRLYYYLLGFHTCYFYEGIELRESSEFEATKILFPEKKEGEKR